MPVEKRQNWVVMLFIARKVSALLAGLEVFLPVDTEHTTGKIRKVYAF
jgi:hypothetical protein